MSKKVLIPLAQGFEEIEFITIADVLTRAGLDVIIAGLNDKGEVKGANGIAVVATSNINEVDFNSIDAICLPGGVEGMENLRDNAKVLEAIKILNDKRALVSAICASPVVLHKAGVLSQDFTCYPGFEGHMDSSAKDKRLHQAVVEDGHIITSAGPATSMLFALSVVKNLCGDKMYNDLKEGLLLPLVS